MALSLWSRVSGLRRVLLTDCVQNPHKAITAGLRSYEPPPDFSGISMKERPKLRFMNKVPDVVKVVKVPRSLKDIRGPALHSLEFNEGQYGILALGGGYLHWGHFEMMRLTLNRKFDPRTTFSNWLIEAPHKPITRKGLGQRMGGGKGAVDHYVTAVKADQLIVEVGGRCEFAEVLPVLNQVAKKLPFPAIAVSRETLKELQEELEERKRNNQNPWTFERLVTRNMMGCRKYLSPYDLHFKGRYWGKRCLKDRV
ncbi:39S ribosomal protein L16, mitochondrial isoform X1 [Hyla sarda]|uniref:39S ribosomal protein L16, mitochondrial isoform X1 n=2 Tax=Hyla sarda TaxID=327740 RepID=UPI0024C24B3C|nr:39S ribosomal protein L16, mitochondrial isoform X1 [Hyla sarda]